MTAEPLVCGACRARYRAGAQFCPACGHGITTSATHAPPADRPGPDSAAPRSGAHREIRKVGWLFGLLLFSSLVQGVASRFYDSLWAEVVASVFDAVVVLAFVVTSWQQVAPLLKHGRFDRRIALQLAAASVALFVVLSGYFVLLEHVGVPILRLTQAFRRSGWPLWSMVVLVSVMPAIFEELAFRGVMQSGLERVLGAREAWLIQAALFSVLHLAPIIFPSHFLMGLCFGFLRWRSGSVYPGMALHGLWNATVLVRELRG